MSYETVQVNINYLKGKFLFPIHNSSFKLYLHSQNEALKQSLQITYPKIGEVILIHEVKLSGGI